MEDDYAKTCSQISSQGRNTISSEENVPPQSTGALFQELFTSDSLLELCNSFWKRSPSAKRDVQPYLRGCKWSPDGTCCLSVVNHDGFHIMELPHDLYQGSPTRDRMITMLPATVHVKEAGIVYDFCWYPKMNSYIPETCSWISTKKNSPIQMWDAYNGSLRCSYRGFNAVDEMEPALSVIFTHQGQRIIGGYKNCLRTFDVERPGRDFFEHKITSPAACFATDEKLLAVGSWNTGIKLFSISDMGTYRSVGNMYAHSGGVTHIQFTPDKTKIVSGARKDHNILVWDIRYFTKPLNVLKRCVTTNQRIYFDISSCGRYLVSGGTDGVIRVWDENHIKWSGKYGIGNTNEESATFRFQLHQDSCNSISLHPSRPIIATGSGQYHFVDPVKILEQESDSSNDEESKSVPIMPLSNKIRLKENERLDKKGGSSVNVYDQDKSEKSSAAGLMVESKNVFQVEAHKLNALKEFSNEAHLLDSTKDLDQKRKQESNKKLISEIQTTNLGTQVSFGTDESNIIEEPPFKRFIIDRDDKYDLEVHQKVNFKELSDSNQVKLSGTNIVNTATNMSKLVANDIIISDKENVDKESIINVDKIDKSTCETRLLEIVQNSSKITAVNLSDSESDVSSNGDNVNDIVYSSQSENNLTFWWIANILDVS